MALNLELEVENLAGEASDYFADKAARLMVNLGRSMHAEPLPFMDGPSANSGLQLSPAKKINYVDQDIEFL